MNNNENDNAMVDDDCYMPDVGRYYYLRSSRDRRAMMFDEGTMYDPVGKLWFERFGGGYCDYKDAMACQEADDEDIIRFWRSHRGLQGRESFCDIWYGNNENEIKHALFYLVEYKFGMCRSYSFTVKDVTRQELNEIETAVKAWHVSGCVKYSNVFVDTNKFELVKY